MGAVGPELYLRSRFLLQFPTKQSRSHVCRSKPIDGRTSTNIILKRGHALAVKSSVRTEKLIRLPFNIPAGTRLKLPRQPFP